MAASSVNCLPNREITLVEVQARLVERRAPVGIGTLHRFSVRHGTTRKKRPDVPP